MVRNKPMPLLRFAAISAVAAMPAATAAADLAASEAVSRLAAWLDAQGVLFEAESVSEGRGAVMLNTVRINSKQGQEAESLLIDWLNFFETGDGSVAVEFPGEIVTGYVNGNGQLDHRTLKNPGTSVSVSESGSGLRLSVAAPLYRKMVESEHPVSGRAEKSLFILREWRVDADLAEGSGNVPLRIMLEAEELESRQSSDDNSSADFSLSDLYASFSGTADRLFGGFDDPFGHGPARAGFGFSAADLTVADAVVDGLDFAFSTGPFDIATSSGGDKLEFTLQIDGAAMLAIAAGRAMRAAELSDFSFSAEVFNRKERGGVEFAVRQVAADVAVNPDMVAAFGGGLTLPPGAADLLTGNLVFDSAIELTGEQAGQLFKGQEVNFSAPDLVSWRLKELWIEFFGMAVAAHGEFDIRPGKQRRHENDVRGSLYAELTGVGGFLDVAEESGLLPLETLLFLKVMAAMGEETGDDRLGYEIEIAGENGVFLNGAQLR